MLPLVVAVVWGYLMVEGEKVHVHEICSEMRLSAYVKMPVS